MQITLENVSYIYSADTAYEKTALRDVSLEIAQGEFLGIIGHTGSGKSTLIQHLNGLMKATKGRVLCDGKDILSEDFDLKKYRTRVGLVFQYPEHQLFEETVLKDVCFGPKNMGLSEDACEEKARKCLKLVGFPEELFAESPFDLSGGQQRRVAIAGVLAMMPEVLVLDEPTAGLDPAGRDEILDEIRHLHETLGITVVLVSHSMEDVGKYVDRLVVMDKGRVFLDGKTKEVFTHADALEEIGLAAPMVSYVLGDLKKKGFPVKTSATTVEDARDEILSALKERGIL